MGQSANPKSKLRAQINKVANFCAAQWQDFAPALTGSALPWVPPQAMQPTILPGLRRETDKDEVLLVGSVPNVFFFMRQLK